MHRVSALWRANTVAFISSFCVMVIELIAGRILAPYIGVSLYTWTSIIGVILGGIALGNYLGGKIADRYPSPSVLAGIFFAGGLLTVAVLPATKLVTAADWFDSLPVMGNFVLKTSSIFFLPAIVLSMVSPMVIKLTLADLGRTGGIVGTIYAWSTVGAILGTFMTGFFFILWFGVRTIVWLVAVTLILTGIIAWFSWRMPNRWKPSLKSFLIWLVTLEVLLTFVFLFQFRQSWQESYTKESNYYTIRVMPAAGGVKALLLDKLIHGYSNPDSPTVLVYDYLNVFVEITSYLTQTRGNLTPRVLHLGGGAYSFPRYLEVAYPQSVNEVVEIDPAVTQVAYEELGLSSDTKVRTYNQDARLFFVQRKDRAKYDIIVGDVFSDRATPYHLTTLEFARLVKANLAKDGVYLINVIDDYQRGRYLPSFLYTLKRAFNYVYLFSTTGDWENLGEDTFVIVATEQRIDLADYKNFITDGGRKKSFSHPYEAVEEYLAQRAPLLLTDDYAPTDILVAWLFRKQEQD